MSSVLVEVAIEGSTYTIEVTVKDETDTAITPETISWKLTDEPGSVIINNLDDESATPGNPTKITLSGDDLQILTTEKNYAYRKLSVWGTYDSSYGTDLPFQGDVVFKLRDLAAR